MLLKEGKIEDVKLDADVEKLMKPNVTGSSQEETDDSAENVKTLVAKTFQVFRCGIPSGTLE